MKVHFDFNVQGTIDFIEEEEGKPRLRFSIQTNENIIVEDITMLVLPVDKKGVIASVQAVDSKGNSAPIDGVPSWTSSAPSIATVTPDEADPMKAVIAPVGPIGSLQINVTADADLGTGIKTISGVLEVNVVAGEAVGFVISTVPLE